MWAFPDAHALAINELTAEQQQDRPAPARPVKERTKAKATGEDALNRALERVQA
ncbi:hypothetical protein GCM10011360_26440 [Primorskyibacter flagellatus]|uniref:Uncharacterized protein n=1 Tax=Primorskyibacter flagellatus TaxID=1387277 RepID=A0A917AAD8_9RHOB|nr:hypothetical protein [Primorskyibacter flagellatus]GGE37356.1 hypothetical protein GCM10011360_26440 [Primorskyibacter flagellatus]